MGFYPQRPRCVDNRHRPGNHHIQRRYQIYLVREVPYRVQIRLVKVPLLPVLQTHPLNWRRLYSPVTAFPGYSDTIRQLVRPVLDPLGVRNQIGRPRTRLRRLSQDSKHIHHGDDHVRLTALPGGLTRNKLSLWERTAEYLHQPGITLNLRVRVHPQQVREGGRRHDLVPYSLLPNHK